MTKNLDLIEESDLWDKMVNPFLNNIGNSFHEKRRLAIDIYNRSSEEILFIDPFGFGIDSIFAGLSEKQIEYLAKHAPAKYRKELISIFSDKEMMDGVWEIAKAMDEDLDDGSNRNQKRIRSVIQYIRDNRAVFQV